MVKGFRKSRRIRLSEKKKIERNKEKKEMIDGRVKKKNDGK